MRILALWMRQIEDLSRSNKHAAALSLCGRILRDLRYPGTQDTLWARVRAIFQTDCPDAWFEVQNMRANLLRLLGRQREAERVYDRIVDAAQGFHARKGGSVYVMTTAWVARAFERKAWLLYEAGRVHDGWLLIQNASLLSAAIDDRLHAAMALSMARYDRASRTWRIA